MHIVAEMVQMHHLIKLHDGLWCPGRIQRKDVIWSIDFLFCLDVVCCSHNLLDNNYFNMASSCDVNLQLEWWNIKKITFGLGIYNIIHAAIMEADLWSNFVNFFGLVNSTKHFKQHPSCLISFSKLSSGSKKKPSSFWSAQIGTLQT